MGSAFTGRLNRASSRARVSRTGRRERHRGDLRPLVLFVAERLDDADAAYRLVDRGGHLGALVELGPRERGEPGPDHAQQLDADRDRQHRDDRERRAQDEQVHADADERGPERERDRQQVHIDCTICRSESERVISWPPAIVSRSRTSAVWIVW